MAYFAQFVGPMVVYDRNLTICPIKPTSFSEPLSETDYPCLPMSVLGFLVLLCSVVSSEKKKKLILDWNTSTGGRSVEKENSRYFC